MARKIKTVSPKTRQRSATLPEFRSKLDLCRIDTARIRKLSTTQLKKAIERVGPIYTLPAKETGKSFRWILSAFMSDLHSVKTTPIVERDVKFKENWGTREDPNWADSPRPGKTPEEIEAARQTNIRRREAEIREADRRERQIWTMQAKAGCKIRDAELVARDAERADSATPRHEYDSSVVHDRRRADEVRERERVRTPYKGRKPIIR